MSSSTAQRAVIVGAGMAGVQTAVSLREQGWGGTVTLLGAEAHAPYDRPPLSKGVTTAAFDVDFGALDVELLLGRRAEALSTAERHLTTDAGPIPYDRLVIATGAQPVALPGPGGGNTHVLRTLDDAVALRPVLEAKSDVVVVGAGWIGAEFATVARQAGCAVSVVEAADRPLAGALPAEIGERMRGWYAESGVELRTDTAVAAVEPGAVVLGDGTRLRAEAVVVGVGARPATDWLADSGVALDPGDRSVLADDRLRTSVTDVYAVGDCASFPSARYGQRLLIHHWDNAVHGPRVAAVNLLGGDERYDPVPYFWSEQFGRFVQYAGHHSPADTMLPRGDPDGPAWSVCWLREGALTALLAVGRPRDLAQGRKLIERGARLDPALAADPAVPLKTAARTADR